MADEKNPDDKFKPTRANGIWDRPRTQEELSAVKAMPLTKEDLAFIRDWGLDKSPEDRAKERDAIDNATHLQAIADEVDAMAKLAGAEDDDDFKDALFGQLIRGVRK